MAFLCPVRIRSNGNAKKKKHPDAKKRSFLSGAVNSLIGEQDHISPVVVDTTPRSENGSGGGSGPGRITGSSSIETLVRVGLEKEAGIPPEARVIVLHDFTPCVDDELEVKRGSIVSILYRENDWVYVILEQLPNGVKVNDDHGGREGFIPHSYCGPLNETQNVRKKPSTTTNLGPSSTETAPFYKDPSPTRYIALYKFTARDENDVNVERGEILTVLNKDDPEWFYVVRSDGQEGFVPSAFVYPLAQEPQNTYQQIDEPSHEYAAAADVTQAAGSPGQSSCNTSNPEFQNHGTELVMLYDYKAQAPDDLSVKRGDWIYADLHHQTVEGWLWAYAPKQRKYGFIPKAYARPPAMTSL